MNRRGFFGLLSAAAIAPLVPMPELAELLAPKRTIFLPPAGGWLSSRGVLRYIEFYDIWRDQLIGRHDVMIGGEQFSAHQVIGLTHTPEQAHEMARHMMAKVLSERGLSVSDMRQVPMASMVGSQLQSYV